MGCNDAQYPLRTAACIAGMPSVFKQRQRGAITIMSAVALVVALTAVALAVDLGRLVYEKRRLQGIADAAALDAARAFGPCAAVQGDVAAAALASAKRNGHGGGIEVETGIVKIGTDHLYSDLQAPGPDDIVNAVKVTATGSMPRSLFARASLPGEQTLNASAIARMDAVAGLRAGSFLARVDSSRAALLNALLGGLLDMTVNLDALAYNGLLNTTVAVRDLLNVQAGIGTVEELLDANLGLGQFLGLVAAALENKGDTLAVAVNNLALTASTGLRLTIGDLLEIEQGGEQAALDAALNVFDLLVLGAQAANTNNAVKIDLSDGTLLGLSGLGDLDVTLKIVEPPQIAIGSPGRNAAGDYRTRVKTAQVRLQVDLSLLGGSGTGPINLNLFLEAAQTTAGLNAIQCASRGDPLHRATVDAVPGIAQLGVGKFQNINSASPEMRRSDIVKLPLLGQVSLQLHAPLAPAAPVALEFIGPPWGGTQTVGTPLGSALSTALNDLARNLDVEINLLGLDLGPLDDLIVRPLLMLVASLLKPVLLSLDDVLLAPLLQALGINLGGADIAVISLVAVQPHLVR